MCSATAGQVRVGVRVERRWFLVDPGGGVVIVPCKPEVVEEIGDGLTQRRAVADPASCPRESDGAASTRWEEGGSYRGSQPVVTAG